MISEYNKFIFKMPSLIKRINSLTANLPHDLIQYKDVVAIFSSGNYDRIIHTIHRICYRGENGLMHLLSPELQGLYIELSSFNRYGVSVENINYIPGNRVTMLLGCLVESFTAETTYFFFKILKKMKILFMPQYLEKILYYSSQLGNVSILHKCLNLYLFTMIAEERDAKIQRISNKELLFTNKNQFENVFRECINIAIAHSQTEAIHLLARLIGYDGDSEKVDFTITNMCFKAEIDIYQDNELCTHEYLYDFYGFFVNFRVDWLSVKNAGTPAYYLSDYIQNNPMTDIEKMPELVFFQDKSFRRAKNELEYYIRYIVTGSVCFHQEEYKKEHLHRESRSNQNSSSNQNNRVSLLDLIPLFFGGIR